MRSKNLELNQALAFDKLEEFVRQEEARGAELVRGSDFERALALLTVQRQTRSRIYSPNSKFRIGSHPFNGTL
jgi:hypothetical protein